MKYTGILLAYTGGLLAGAVIGIMLAPDKGNNTRDKVFKYASNVRDKAKNKVKNYLEAHGVKLECHQLDELVDELISKDSPANE